MATPTGNARLDKLLKRIVPADQRGLEIGALDRPTVTPNEGFIRYVDWTTTDALRKARADDPTVNVEQLVPVHYVWGERTLKEAVGADAPVDYVIASHVIEHVPDLIGWLREVSSVLKPGGVVSFIVPDKRFTFDRLRPLTRSAELVEAFLERRRKPSFRQIFDHYALHVRVDLPAAWAGAIDDDKLVPVHDDKFALQKCREAETSGRYVDSHCWVFTPRSFVACLRAAIELELIDLRVVDFFPTIRNEMDFFVALERLPAIDVPAQLASLPRIEEEEADWIDVREVPQPGAAPPSVALLREPRDLATRLRDAAHRAVPGLTSERLATVTLSSLPTVLRERTLPLDPPRPPPAGEVLWLDRADASEEAARRAGTPFLREHAANVLRDGLTTLPGLIDPTWCDDLVAAFREYCHAHQRTAAEYRDAHGLHERLVNFHMTSEPARRIATHPRLVELLDVLLGYRAALYSSLVLEKGGQQPIHHDGPFFRTEPEGFFFGVWVALEDVDPEAGPFTYYRGGHRVRLDRAVMMRELKLGHVALFHEYNRRLEVECRRRRLLPERPLLKKGDVMIWHPWLPQGDRRIHNPQRSRNSLVAHYLPEGTVTHPLESFFERSYVDSRKTFQLLRHGARRYVDMGAPSFAHNH